MTTFCSVLIALGSVLSAPEDALPTPLTTRLVASELDRPLFVAAPPGDRQRLFVLEQVEARIRIVRDGELLPVPFLDIDALVNDGGGERGLLGLAFHPDYARNGYFYVNYIDNGTPGDTVIMGYRVSENPDVADPDSAFPVLRIPQPFSNHNGGMMAFGPMDGYLYIAAGDGGSSNDPQNNAQRLDTLLGKILRIDVDGGSPYGIPAGNPFTGQGAAQGEIWAYGLRNPWRFAFDRITGDLYIGDVGQGAREEIGFQAGNSAGGENYGWSIAEGFACRGGTGTCGTQAGFTPPIHDYPRTEGTSVTGGHVYRGGAIPDLSGTYLFGDFGSGRVWSLRYDGQNMHDFRERTAELDPPGEASIGNISSFGEDARGELYIVDYDGEVWRIEPVEPVADVDGNGAVDAADVQTSINAALGFDVSPADADLDNDGAYNARDVQLCINAVLGA